MKICQRPGCLSYAVAGEETCLVHRHPEGGKLCEACRGSGWFLPKLPCSRCGGVGLADFARHASRAGRDRKREKVDTRGLIQAAEQD